VLAFEASPRNHAHLLHNVATNGVAQQVEIRQQALGQTAGQLNFDLGPAEQSGWGGFASDASAHSVTVDVLRLDEVWQRPQDIAALKIDVEGADTWVLRGAESLLRQRRIGVIYFEQNKPRMQALGIHQGEAEAFLKDCGYAVVPMSDPSLDLVEFTASPRGPRA
jgi:FkbM family methyltransferase